VRIHDVARPDVIVRDRSTGELAVVNWKTINDLTDERRENHAKGLQAFREHYFAEAYLRQLKGSIQTELEELSGQASKLRIDEIRRKLDAVQKIILLAEKFGESGQIDYTQFIYLVKGKRVREEQLQMQEFDGSGDYVEKDDFEFGSGKKASKWRQDSFLVYPWVRQKEMLEVERDGKKVNYHPAFSYVWRYQKPGGNTFNTLGKANYKREMTTLTGLTVEGWVKALNAKKVFPNTIRPDLPNPLAKLIVWDAPVYRKVEMMESLNRQLQLQQDERVGRLIEIEELYGEPLKDKVESLFPQHLHSCQTPIKCTMYPFCHENKPIDYLGVPEGYVFRTSHHHAERKAQEEGDKDEEGILYRVIESLRPQQNSDLDPDVNADGFVKSVKGEVAVEDAMQAPVQFPEISEEEEEVEGW
jgi:hypothetical protein